MRLTEISVRALKGSDTYVTYFDDTLPGFGVRVGKRSRTFVVLRGKKRERVSIGKWPDLTVGEARAEAKRLLIEEPRPRQTSVIFETARDAFLDHYENQNTRYIVECTFKKHCARLHGSYLANITTEDIESCLDGIRAPSARLHAFRYLRAMFRFSLRPPRRWLKHSPLEGYEPPGTDKRGTRILSDDELVRIWHASPAVFRLMILWGTRNGETCALEREWEREDSFVIPGRHTKNGRDHAVPVLPLARHILTGESNQYVFPGRWGEGHLTPAALPKLKRDVMEKSGTSGWQIRDLRRTFRSNMARLRVPREVAELLINHAPQVLDDIYDRYSYLDEKREALARYEASLVWLLARV
jgi:integrase